MKERDRQLLLHIINNCNKIRTYQNRFGDTYEIFQEDEAYRDAVCMCIMQIGELANGFTEEFKANVPFPWREIRGMRNILAHEYLNADPELLWETAKEDVPLLLCKCNELLQQKELRENEDEVDDIKVSYIPKIN